jgi:uncharacterized protein (DUF779 family)
MSALATSISHCSGDCGQRILARERKDFCLGKKDIKLSLTDNTNLYMEIP